MKEFSPLFRGTVAQGELKMWSPEGFRKHLSSLRGEVEVIVRKWKKRRVIEQNSLYWAYLKMIEEDTGNPSVYLHEYFKNSLLPHRVISLGGKKYEVPMSTTELSTIEFTNYLKRIEAETGLPIPPVQKVDAGD